jgi:hypothetical protein
MPRRMTPVRHVRCRRARRRRRLPARQPRTEEPGNARDQGTVEPAAAAPVQPFGWSTATPAVPRPSTTAPTSDSPASITEPATPPQSATADAPARAEPPAAPPSRAPLRAATIERAAAPVEVEAGTHMPALLGAALALLIVVLGSIVARLAASLIRSRRRNRALAATAAMTTPPMFSAPMFSALDAPALVPVMPRERDVTRKRRPPRRPTDMPAARQERAQDAVAGDAPARMRADARLLEENVRDLLRRMRSDLLDKQPAPAEAPVPQPTAAQEFDQMLAKLRERRRRPA